MLDRNSNSHITHDKFAQLPVILETEGMESSRLYSFPLSQHWCAHLYVYYDISLFIDLKYVNLYLLDIIAKFAKHAYEKVYF